MRMCMPMHMHMHSCTQARGRDRCSPEPEPREASRQLRAAQDAIAIGVEEAEAVDSVEPLTGEQRAYSLDEGRTREVVVLRDLGEERRERRDERWTTRAAAARAYLESKYAIARVRDERRF